MCVRESIQDVFQEGCGGFRSRCQTVRDTGMLESEPVLLLMTPKPQLFVKNILGAEGGDYGKPFDEHYQQQKMYCE